MKLNRRTNWRNKMNALQAAQQLLRVGDLEKSVILKITNLEGSKFYRLSGGVKPYDAGAIFVADKEVCLCEHCDKFTDKFERLNNYCPCCFEKGKRVGHVNKNGCAFGTICAHEEGRETVIVRFDGMEKTVKRNIHDLQPCIE